MNKSTWPEITELQQKLRDFAQQRDWDQFHTPKNLAIALSVEAAELLEHFQWQSESESASRNEQQLAQVAAELADVQIYLARLADKLDIDLGEAVASKLAENEAKYPAELVRGSSKKYSEY